MHRSNTAGLKWMMYFKEKVFSIYFVFQYRYLTQVL